MTTATGPIEEGATVHAHGDHLHHHPKLAHHFDSMEQQHNSAKLGIWLFLVTEILMFSGLFLTYAVFRTFNPEAVHIASRQLSLGWGGVNTMVLIFSSLTMALSVRAAQINSHKQVFWWLVVTLTCGFLLMIVKNIEYSAKFEHGIFPGVFYNYHSPGHVDPIMHSQAAINFFTIYFLMTGLHGFHVLIGMGLLGWLAWRAYKRQFDSTYYTPVEVVGLYWHIVDVIWIFLFPLLYLIDRSPVGH
jgi:cytochrome c oxidase subunit III